MWRFCKELWVLAYKPNIGISDIRTGAGLLKTNIMLMTVENMRKVLVLFDRGSHQNEQYLTIRKGDPESSVKLKLKFVVAN